MAGICTSHIPRPDGCLRRRRTAFSRRRLPRRRPSALKTRNGFGGSWLPRRIPRRRESGQDTYSRMWLLPDQRVVVVLISPGGISRDKILRPGRPFTQAELDATAEFLNRHYTGWTLEAIRADLLQKLATERERYEGLVQSALALCDSEALGDDAARQVYVEGAVHI